MKRLQWVDGLRGIGILAVVFGHATHTFLFNAIYAFHIPLFFLVSGFVYRASGTLFGYGTHRARQLLVPYLLWLTFLSLPGFVVALSRHRLPDAVENWAFGGARLALQTGPLWFVTALYVSLVLYDALRKRAPGWTTPAAVLLYALAMLRQYAFRDWSFFWAADVALLAVPYLHFGALAREGGWDERKPWTFGLAALFLGYLGLTAFGIALPRVDLKHAEYGLPGVDFLLAVGGTAFCLLLAKHAGPLAKALSYAGRASLLVMFLHYAVLVVLARKGFENGYLGFLLATAVPLLLYPVLQRFQPSRTLLLGEVGSGRPKSDEEPRIPNSHSADPAPS